MQHLDSSPVRFRLCIYVDNIYSLLVGGCFEGDFVYVLVRLAYYCSLLVVIVIVF